jgi:anti-anti-sigma factor
MTCTTGGSSLRGVELLGPAGPDGLRVACHPDSSSAIQVLVSLEGVVDGVTAPGLTRILGRLCRAADTATVLIDFQDVTFFGAAGATCLDAAAHLGRRTGTRVALCRVPPFIRRTLGAACVHPDILVGQPPD